ncbi:hypothetical protein ABTK11_20265, partial [Acinetobacter baumannii]
GWRRGVWFYQASTVDCEISYNKFETGDGIFIEPCQNIERSQFNPVWDTVVHGNTITSEASAGGTINITGDLQKTSELLGTLALNNQIYG